MAHIHACECAHLGSLQTHALLQGRKVSFGLLKDLGEWYRTLMSVAVCVFFAWVNFVARCFAHRTGKAKTLRKKRLEVQAKHKHGPVYVAASEPSASGASGGHRLPVSAVDAHEPSTAAASSQQPSQRGEDTGVMGPQLRHKLDRTTEQPE